MRGTRTTKPAGRAGVARRDPFTLVDFGPPFDRDVHGESDLDRALGELFRAAAPDLGVSDPSDDAFVDYAGDKMSDAGVPLEVADAALERCRGARARRLRGRH